MLSIEEKKEQYEQSLYKTIDFSKMPNRRLFSELKINLWKDYRNWFKEDNID